MRPDGRVRLRTTASFHTRNPATRTRSPESRTTCRSAIDALDRSSLPLAMEQKVFFADRSADLGEYRVEARVRCNQVIFGDRQPAPWTLVRVLPQPGTLTV